jgi:dihydrofolate synthase/folylpolyglutamate synthase
MTYAEAIEFLYRLRWFGAKFGLENTRQLAVLAGNPQERLRFIHVAGTNGKGSTCAMLESIYRAAGLRVGLFTSPHLVSFRERMQVNRRLISEADVVRLVGEMQPWLATFPVEHHPTFFEVVTVMALRYFAEQRCELVIWETGLGGRLDATNIVTPLASVITNIGYDHQQWLGNTLPAIAAEKAGIIKPGVPVLTATSEPEALAVIERIAHERNAPLACVGAHPTSRIPHPASLPLLGEHQRLNATLAAATVEALQNQIPVGDAAVAEGLSAVEWPGRLQLVTRADGQKILLDGAHNFAGAEVLRAALIGGLSFNPAAFQPQPHRAEPPRSALPQNPLTRPEATLSPAQSGGEGRERGCDPLQGSKVRIGIPRILTLILGVLADKDWRAMCEILAPLAARIATVTVSSERTAGSTELAAACRQANPQAEVFVCPSLAEAMGKTARDEFVVIAGSLYLVGEALEFLGLSTEVGAGERALNEWGGAKAGVPSPSPR